MPRSRTVWTIVTALATAVALLLPGASASATPGPRDAKPLPGGIQIPGGPLIHLFAPGPEDLGFMGLDVEPGTITDVRGFSALAYPAGTATDGAGNTYIMFNDFRVFRGKYIGTDGKVHHGTFAFI